MELKTSSDKVEISEDKEESLIFVDEKLSVKEEFVILSEYSDESLDNEEV